MRPNLLARASLLVAFVLVVPAARAVVQPPVLKWKFGGCNATGTACQLGWYSSPAVADLDGNGTQEVVAGLYSVFVLDGATGNTLWKMPAGYDRSNPAAADKGRTWADVVVTDLNNDGVPEMVVAQGGGWVSVFDNNGYFKPGWPVQPTTSELRGLAVYDLDGDGQKEIIVTAAIGSRTNTWVYEPNGTLRPGWPQMTGSVGYAYGVYADNPAAGDPVSGHARVVVPSDISYVAAYRDDGTQIDANAVYGTKKWAEISAWIDPATEKLGYGSCDGTPAQSYRGSFTTSPAVIADVNHDGARETVVAGNVNDCSSSLDQYVAPYLLNEDRSRFVSGPWDWSSLPASTGAPLSEDYNVIENAIWAPVVADLDGDGVDEILYPSYDGRLHAFWLDKTEHGAWPYSVYSPSEGKFRFASPPVVADLDADGQAEVIFTSWVQKGTNLVGRLHIVDSLGHLLQQVDLPSVANGATWNGALGSPTLANIDSDPDLELVVVTANTGVVAYDLPGTANARVLWSTGRWNNQRSGSCIAATPGPVDATVSASRSGSDVALGWAPQAGAAEYHVWRSTAPNMSGAVRVGVTGSTSFVDAGAAAAGSSYYYQVRSRNACGVEGP